MRKNAIGLNAEKAMDLACDLNNLLANAQVYYQNLRGVHWNIHGQNFFELHAKFEELYIEAQENVDLIAERILTLGGTPLHTFEDYIKTSTVSVGKDISKDEDCVRLILGSLSSLLEIERELLDKSDKLNDEGTNSMVSDFITVQEKVVWMLESWLGKKI
ncbi:MAG: Dps family protein [Flavobacteriales bacterium AspAUS03]